MSVRGFVRGAWVYVRAQLVAGLLLGLGLRLAMRVVALTDAEPGTRFTPGVTLAILLVAVVLSVVVSLPFFLLRRFVPGTPVRKGLVMGGAAIPLGGALVIGEALTVGNPWLNVPMFFAVLVGFGVAFSVVVARLERRRAMRGPAVTPAPGAQVPALPSATPP